jgi:ribosomal protein S18 acetylase RimI-like enzyme
MAVGPAEMGGRLGPIVAIISAMTELRTVGPDDWQVWRGVRLAALADAPEAFGARLADWQGANDREERWRQRLSIPGAEDYLAYLDGQPVGMATGVPAEDGGDGVELISMWVSPAVRGRGVADALIAAVEGYARRRGARVLRLDVRTTNVPAIRLYERNGLTDVGEAAEPDERTMEKVLR